MFKVRAEGPDNFFGKVLTVYLVLCTDFLWIRLRSSEINSLEVEGRLFHIELWTVHHIVHRRDLSMKMYLRVLQKATT